MKAKPVRLIYGHGYEASSIEDATHVKLNIPGPTGILHLPVMLTGKREGTGNWSWNGSTEAPTLKPSIRTSSHSGWVCHSWINDGRVQYLEDSTHEFKGTMADLLDVE